MAIEETQWLTYQDFIGANSLFNVLDARSFSRVHGEVGGDVGHVKEEGT